MAIGEKLINRIPSVRYFFRMIGKIKLPRVIYIRKYQKMILVSYIAILLPLTGYSIYRQKTAPKEVEKKEEEAQPLPMVKVFKVEREDFKEILEAMGTVKGTSEIDLKFEISGKIASFNFREGDQVARGEIIVSLDSEDVMTRLRYAKSKLQSVVAKYDAAKEKLGVYRELYQMGAIIKTKINEMELSVDSLKSEVDSAREEVALAQSQIDKTVVPAPEDGVMGTRLVEVGDFVTPNDVVGTFLEVKSVFVEMGVIEKNIEKVALNQKVKVMVDAYPDDIFWGEIFNISKMVRGKTRTLPVKVRISNPKQRLYSGMFAECEIYLTEIKEALVVPTASVIDLGQMVVVPLVKMVGNQDTKGLVGMRGAQIDDQLELNQEERIGVVELRKVELGYASDQYTHIKDGLDPNDMIVMETQQPLKDGMKVKIIEVIVREQDG
ncbi:MAG: efflux RND transporter periplasmic adaptor subunit [Elusimicrobia bacterium]|nr:efflux RND transporter periplasmic adaptor subunit [Elusimicrobiota bacterium]